MYVGVKSGAYNFRYGLLNRREDADGTVHIMAHAGASATAGSPKILQLIASASNPLVGVGWFATAPFATGMASATAVQYLHKTYVGIARDNVPSDTDGWFQIGGPFTGVVYATQDFYINCTIKWSAAVFGCSATVSGLNITAGSDNAVGTFAVSLSSVSQGTYDWYLFGLGCVGIG
jgi:hypothetical protein